MGKNVVFSLEDVPKEHKTAEERITYLQDEIKETSKNLNKEGKASVESAVRLGCMLNVLKGLVNGQKKGSWEKYRETKCTSVNKRTAQRCMALACSLGPVLEENVKLSWAGQTRLLHLAKLARKVGKEVGSLLEEHEIALDFNPKKVKEVKAFQDQIDSLIYEPESRERKSKEKKKQVSVKHISEFGEMAETCCSLLEKKKSRESLLSGLTSHGIKEIIEKVKQLLNQLKDAKEQMSDVENAEEAA